MGKCVHFDALLISDSIISLISDASILIILIPILWSLQLPFMKKLKVAFFLGAGGIPTITNVYRLVLTIQGETSDNQTQFFLKLCLTGYVSSSFFGNLSNSL